MVSVVPALFGLVFVAAGLFILWQSVSEFQTVYHVLTNDPVAVRQLPTRSGPVEVDGTAVAADDHDPIRSPFTDTECLAYEYEVQEYRSSGKHSNWRTLDQGMAGVPFRISDDADAVRVEPAGAELRLEEHTVRVDGGEEPPAQIAQYIRETDAVDSQNKSLDLVVTELNTGNDQKFTEHRLETGEEVYVYGVVGPGSGGGWGSEVVDAVVEDGDEVPEFVVSDTSERGTAWRIGKAAVAKVVFGLVFAGAGVVVVVLSMG